MERTLFEATAPKVRGASLTVISGGTTATTIRIGPDACIVGRHPSCHLVIRDPKVSSTHMELVASERGVRVRDLGSTNGTFVFVDDEPLEVVDVCVRRKMALRCGDAILELRPHRPEPLPLSRRSVFGGVVGSSPAMRALFERLARIAPSSLSVLIEGETGTGKEILARAIHDASGRADKPFVIVDCAALTSSLAESLLFGHEKGAFTGATTRHVSPFVEASGGTVFLDELGELPLEVQPKLLRVLAEQRVKPVGARAYVSTDVRVIAATRRDLLSEINRRAFRDDLYFRIAEERVRLPPLRERTDDLGPLVQRVGSEAGQPALLRRVPPSSLEALGRYHWPGNVRELRSLVRRALAYDEGGPLRLETYLDPKDVEARNAPAGTHIRVDVEMVATFREVKRAYALRLFHATGGNLAEMARRAKISRVTAREWLRKYGLRKAARSARNGAATPQSRRGPPSRPPSGVPARAETSSPSSRGGSRARRTTSA